MKLQLACKPALIQELQRAVDCGKAHRWILCFHESVEIFTRDVSLSVQKHVQYQISLRGSFQVLATKVFVEYLGLFPLHSHLPQRCRALYTRGQNLGTRISVTWDSRIPATH